MWLYLITAASRSDFVNVLKTPLSSALSYELKKYLMLGKDSNIVLKIVLSFIWSAKYSSLLLYNLGLKSTPTSMCGL